MIDITQIKIKPSPIYAFGKVLPLILVSIFFLFAGKYLTPLFALLSIFLIGMAMYKYAYIRMILYTITAERLIIRSGILIKKIDQLEFYRVKDYVITQPLLMQVFRLMNLTLITTDEIHKNIILPGIPFSNTADTIRNFVQETRHHNRVFEIN